MPQQFAAIVVVVVVGQYFVYFWGVESEDAVYWLIVRVLCLCVLRKRLRWCVMLCVVHWLVAEIGMHTFWLWTIVCLVQKAVRECQKELALIVGSCLKVGLSCLIGVCLQKWDLSVGCLFLPCCRISCCCWILSVFEWQMYLSKLARCFGNYKCVHLGYKYMCHLIQKK